MSGGNTQFNRSLSTWTQNHTLIRWVEEQIVHCKPDRVHLCDGTQEEVHRIAAQMVGSGTLTPLQKRLGSFWCHSHPDDVARVEECTYICSAKQEDAGPTNRWMDPKEMKNNLLHLFAGCMQGRVMYVIPYCMGLLGSSMARVGIEITDSPYVVLNMKLMTRMGKAALEHLSTGFFVPGLHSVGVPLKPGEKDVAWPCNPEKRVIAHFPEEKSIYSFGSGYGGNALLGKKCFALRIASVLGREQGWLAEHMLVLGLTNPEGEKKYIAAAFPSACGKTNLAMIAPTLKGWKVECVGDDIAWMKLGADGRLYAMNPEAGIFGVAPGTSWKTNPNAMRTIEHDTIFTNTALTQDGDVWWEGIDGPPSCPMTSWLGVPWDPKGKMPAAHPNSRFTVSAKQCPIYNEETKHPEGVPISAILFGGRRHSLMPLVLEAFDWNHGVFLGASLSSETTAAAKGEMGKLRHDPFAMLPFCGYNMADYFAHWLSFATLSQSLPHIYSVNWFRKDKEGNYLWPGYGENCRVLKWILERCSNQVEAEETPIGRIPMPGSLDTSGLSVDVKSLCSFDPKEWKEELEGCSRYFQLFGERLPKTLSQKLQSLQENLSTS